jgi:alcohol dehydrogenase class IV
MKKYGLLNPVVEGLKEAGVEVVVFSGRAEAGDAESVEEGRQKAQREGCDVVLGLGGGRVLDQAKLIAVLSGSNGSVTDYLNGRPLPNVSLPCVAMPTTAGSGAEVAQRVELRSEPEGFKREAGSPALLPKVVLSDPLLTLTLPPGNTASSGLVALTHAVESYLSQRATPTVEALAHYAIGLIVANLPLACRGGQEATVREKMALGSLTAGLGAANIGLGPVHALALALANHFPISHGVGCALVLPAFVAWRAPAVAERMVHLAGALGLPIGFKATPEAAAAAVWKALKQWICRLKMPSCLAQIGVPRGILPVLAAEACTYGSLRHTPREAEEDDLRQILQASYERGKLHGR